MSSTRRAAPHEDDYDSLPSQEAYASSNAHDVGLLGNMVARRCKVAMRPDHRALCYFIQQLSHRDGGLKRIVEEIIAAFPDCFRTHNMARLGIKPGQTLSESERQALWMDSPRRAWIDMDMLLDGPCRKDGPTNDFTWRADDLFEDCRKTALETMPQALRAMCLDPRADMEKAPFRYHLPRRREDEYAETWWINDFVGTLETFRQRHVEAARASIAPTEITRLVHRGIDVAAFDKGLAVIEGLQRSGKTTAAKNYCETHPGECVYIALESGDDDTTFFRSVARSIGTASSGQLTTVKLRGKIEDMLQAGHLTVVIDESHFLAQIKARPTAPPKRLDWVRTSLLDKGVAVALVSTPQFERQLAHFEEHLSWNSGQLRGRIVWQKLLPSTLPESEVEGVARKIAPYADAVSIKLLTAYAVDAPDYLYRIRRIIGNARYLAAQDGRSEPTRADIKSAIAEMTPPAAPEPAAPRRKAGAGRMSRRVAAPVQVPCNDDADGFPAALARRAGMDSPVASAAGFEASERLQFNGAAASD